jgi:hypothetical protein
VLAAAAGGASACALLTLLPLPGSLAGLAALAGGALVAAVIARRELAEARTL